ncbi:hypothetical protein ANO11243_064010 [Dothideomycetidae sp. 11243]|nr:hypothetical protein ANO11243_064010 [fungal sp. No.11243]
MASVESGWRPVNRREVFCRYRRLQEVARRVDRFESGRGGSARSVEMTLSEAGGGRQSKSGNVICDRLRQARQGPRTNEQEREMARLSGRQGRDERGTLNLPTARWGRRVSCSGAEFETETGWEQEHRRQDDDQEQPETSAA